MQLSKEPWSAQIPVFSPLCTGRAEGIHKAGLQCGLQTQFSVDKTTKEEKRRCLRQRMAPVDKVGGGQDLGPDTFFSQALGSVLWPFACGIL